VEFAEVADLAPYGAAVAKSVSGEPWAGRPAPRLAPVGTGMLNGIGIQNPGIDGWLAEFGSRIGALGVPIWGSAVGTNPEEFARVGTGLEGAGVASIEVNLSCPNLDGRMFALDRDASAEVVRAVRGAVTVPLGAKLSPNAPDVGEVAAAVADAGADFVVVGNTVWGAGVDPITRHPLLSGVIGGYSGPAIKPIALRCVIEVRRARPDLPIVGCGGVRRGIDVVEFLLAGASAVAVGTVLFAEPRAGRRIVRELHRFGRRNGVRSVAELVGGMQPW
jgi:dihydroorotate dehydrogenase (NAD+) catalytic subunit